MEAEQLLTHPGTFRGQIVRLRGVFLREYEVEYPENLSGLRQAMTGEVGSPGGTLVTYVLPRSAATDCRLGDDVTVTGRFLQVRRFTSGREGRTYEGPLIMAVAIDRHQRPVVPWQRWVALGVAGAAAVIGLAVGLAQLLLPPVGR